MEIAGESNDTACMRLRVGEHMLDMPWAAELASTGTATIDSLQFKYGIYWAV